MKKSRSVVKVMTPRSRAGAIAANLENIRRELDAC
jgi:hypothetical protein